MNMNRIVRAADSWREQYNPLRGLTMPRAVALMEDAQRGVMADLQWLYGSELGIEATDADLMTIIEKTLAGVADMDWQIVVADPESRGFDAALAEEQKKFLEASYNACDNLAAAIEHLVMARFRGFSHLQPWLKDDWTIEHLEPLPQWNMVRDGTRSNWAWNPAAQQKPYRCFGEDARLSPKDYILLENRRPVNRVALVKYVRSTLSEKDWDAYIDIYGIPGVFIIMPPNVPQGQEDKYRDEAVAAAEAASGALPNGSDVKTLSEVRGMQPFQMRLEWLQKQLILAGTGGMLTSLAEPTGIGGGASGAHESAWQTIIRRVAHKVELPFNQQYDRRALAAVFPGRPALASFALRTRQEKDVGAAVDSISKLSTAGYQVDPAQVEAETGYKVTVKPPQDPVHGGFRGVATDTKGKTPLQTRENGLQNARKEPDGQGDPSGLPPSQIAKNRPSGAGAVLADLAATILDGSVPYEEALKSAQEKLSAIDPAEIGGDLEKALEKAMFDAVAKAAEDTKEAEDTAVSKNRQGEKCPDCGQWLDANGVCHDCHGADELAAMGYNPDDAKMQAAEIGKGKAAIRKCLDEKVDVLDAVSRSDIGTISFLYGEPVDTAEGRAYGLSHLFVKHNGAGIVENLAEALIRGKVREPGKNGNKIDIDWGGYQIHLAKSFGRKGSPTTDKVTWVITGFKTGKEDA